MEFRQFGRTGLKVSAIGFGCWEIGGTYGHVDETQFQRAVHAAIDSRMRFMPLAVSRSTAFKVRACCI
jgi:aryl-alcohol dehydrogenase-like predicted oxidoreductase